MPPSEKEDENQIGNKCRDTVPNDDAGETTGQVCQHRRDDTGYGDCDPEPKTEKPGADGNWRQIKNQERVLEARNVVKPADEGYEQEATGYDQASANHQYYYSFGRSSSTKEPIVVLCQSIACKLPHVIDGNRPAFPWNPNDN